MADDRYIVSITPKSGEQELYTIDSESNLVNAWGWFTDKYGQDASIEVGREQKKDKIDPNSSYVIFANKNGQSESYTATGESLSGEGRKWFDDEYGEGGWQIAPRLMTPRLNTETGAVEGFDDWREPTNTETFFNENGGEYRRLGKEVNKPEYKALRESDRSAKWRVPTGMGGEPVQPEDDEKTTEMWGNIDRYDELRRSYEKAREDDRKVEIRESGDNPSEELIEFQRNNGERIKELEKAEKRYQRGEPMVSAQFYSSPEYEELTKLRGEQKNLADKVKGSESFQAYRDVGMEDADKLYAVTDEMAKDFDEKKINSFAGGHQMTPSYNYFFKEGVDKSQYSKSADTAYGNIRAARYLLQDTQRTLHFNGNVGGGLGMAVTDLDTFTHGLLTGEQKVAIRGVLDHLTKLDKEGKDIMGPDGLTKDELLVLEAWRENVEAHQLMDPTRGIGFNAAQSAVSSMVFIAEMALTGSLVEGIEEKALEGLLEKATSRGLRLVLRRGQRAGATTLSDALAKGVASGIKAGSREFAPMAGKAFAEYGIRAGLAIPEAVLETAANVPMFVRSFGDNLLKYDENGNLPSFWQAAKSAGLDNFVEIYTERGIEPLWNILTYFPKEVVGYASRKLLPGAYRNITEFFTKGEASGVARMLRAGGFQGLPEEMVEEFAGDMIRYVIGTDKDAIHDTFTKDNLLTLFYSFLPMTLLGGGLSMAQVGMAQRNYNRAHDSLANLLGKNGYDKSQIALAIDSILSDPAKGHLGLLDGIYKQAMAEGCYDKETNTFTGRWAQLVKELERFRAAAAQKAVYDGAWESEQNKQMRAEYASINGKMGNDFLYRDTYTEQGQEGTQFSADESGEAEAIQQGEEMADEVQDIAEEMADTEATTETRRERRERKRAEREQRRTERRARREQGLEMSDDERAQRTIDSGRVCVVRTTDGRDVYVLGRAENGEWAVKDTKGGEMTFITDDQIERGDRRGEDGKVIKGEDGKAQKMTAEETVRANTQSLKQYLGARLLFNKEQRDAATERGLKNRANQVRSGQIQQMMNAFYKNGQWGGTFGKRGRYRVADAQTDTGTGLFVYDGKSEKPKLMSWDQIFKVLTGSELASEEMAERVMEEQRMAERGELPTPQEQQEAEQSKTPLQKLPKDKNGDPIFEQAESPAQALDAIIEAVGDEQEGINMAVAQMNDATKEAQEASDKADKAAKTAEDAKTKPKGKTMNEKIAYVNKAKAEAERTAKEAAAAAKTAEFWTSVVEEAQNRSNTENTQKTQQQTEQTPQEQTQEQTENTQTESQQTPQEQTQKPQQKREKRKEEKKEGKRTERDEQRESDRKEYNEMCDAVRAELEKLNVPYRLITSKEEFLTMAKAEGEEFYQQVRSMLNHGTRTYGFARKGAVWIYAPQIFDDYRGDARMDKAKQTIAHEAIAHIGLKNMKDAEKKGGFVAFCKDVYGNVMSAKDREKYLAYQWNINMTEEARRVALGMTEKDGKTPRWEELTAEQRNEVFSSKRGESVIAGAADEYIASIAEKIERGEAISNEERTAWQRFIDWLASKFGVKMNEHDVVDALLESRRRMEGGQTETQQTQTENTQNTEKKGTTAETAQETETAENKGNEVAERGEVHIKGGLNSRIAEKMKKKLTPEQVKKLHIETFTDMKNKNMRPTMGCIYYKDGYAYASDSKILIKVRMDYPAEWEGKLINPQTGKEVEGKFPNADDVIEKMDSMEDWVSVSPQEVLDAMKAAAEAKKGKFAASTQIALNTVPVPVIPRNGGTPSLYRTVRINGDYAKKLEGIIKNCKNVEIYANGTSIRVVADGAVSILMGFENGDFHGGMSAIVYNGKTYLGETVADQMRKEAERLRSEAENLFGSPKEKALKEAGRIEGILADAGDMKEFTDENNLGEVENGAKFSAEERGGGTSFMAEERNLYSTGYYGDMSRRAVEARKKGRFPMYEFTKKYDIPEESVNLLRGLGVISGNEWHDEGADMHKEIYYGWSERGGKDWAWEYSMHKDRIDELAKEYGTIPEVKEPKNGTKKEDYILRRIDYSNPDEFDEFDRLQRKYFYDYNLNESEEDRRSREEAYVSELEKAFPQYSESEGYRQHREEVDRYKDKKTEERNRIKELKDRAREVLNEEIEPIGKGPNGDIYDQFRGKVKEAVEFLRKNQSGDLLGVFHRDDTGDIDLIWGDEGKGLCHIILKHVGPNRDFQSVNELVNTLIDVIGNGRIKRDGESKRVLDLNGFSVVVSRDYNGKQKNWIISAIDTNRSSEEKGIATSPTFASRDARGPEAAAPRNSEGKGSENSGTSKENGENSRFSAEERVEDIDDFDGREGTRFSVVETPEGRSLVGIHNITEDKLRKALKLGGFANPSVAVVDLDKRIHTDFGDISLLLPSEKIDQRSGRNGGTWIGDAWTPKFPDTSRKMSESGEQKMLEDINSLPEAMRLPVRTALENWEDGSEVRGEVRDRLSYLYLNGRGLAPEVMTRTYTDRNGNRTTSNDTYRTARNAMQYITDNGLEREFDKWVDSLDDRYEAQNVIFDGFTPSGNRRYIPATAENVSKWMNKQGSNGSFAGWGGGNVTATAMRRIGTLDEIRGNRNRLVGDDWEMVSFYNKLRPMEDRLISIAGNGDIIEGSARLAEAMRQSNPRGYLESEFGIKLSDEESKELSEYVRAVREELPTLYFETKFNRPVTLDEFASAVVPEGAASDIVSALEGAGLKVSTYKQGDYNDRKRAVKEAATEEVRFSAEERESVQEAANDLERVNEQYNTGLDEFKEGRHRGVFNLGQPSPVLRASGLNGTEMFMTNKTLKDHLEKHGLTVDDIRDLPKALQEPLLVYEWGSTAKSLVVITEIERGDERIAIAVKLERGGNRIEVNEIASVYSANVERFISDMARTEGEEEIRRKFKWVGDKEKALEWLGLVPSEGTASLTEQELSVANVIQDFDNPTLSGENVNFSAEERELSDADTRFSVTPKDEIPEKWIYAYKACRIGYDKDGNPHLYPLKVDPNGEGFDVGVWLTQDVPPILGYSKGGRPRIGNLEKNDKGGKKSTDMKARYDEEGNIKNGLAFRSGLHTNPNQPYASQFNEYDKNGDQSIEPNDIVWVKVKINATKDYTDEAHDYGYYTTKSGKQSWNSKYASFPVCPNGYYNFFTNTIQGTEPWLITDKMQVVEVLTDEQVDELRGEIRTKRGTLVERKPYKNEEEKQKKYDAIRYLNERCQENLAKEAAERNETISNVENPENDTSFSATERVNAADEARERFGVELTPDDLASTSTRHGAMMKALRIATEKGAIPNMDSTELLSFLSDTWRNAPAEVKSSIWETFSESADPDIAREVEQSLAEYVSREVRGIELTEAQRTFLDNAAKTIADRLNISEDNAKYVLWQHVNADNGITTDAERLAMQNALGVTTPASDYEAGVQAETRYSAADEQGVESARDMYEKAMGSIRGALSETGWNEYRALDDLVEAVSKQTGIKYNAWDPRKAFNQLTSNVKAATESYIRDYLLPMWDTIKDICGKRNVSADDLAEYVSLKHGLERNKVLYERDCEAADRNGTERPERRDYSGLTEWITDKEDYKDLTDLDEIEAAAQRIVDGYEGTLGNSANALWGAIRAATGETLREQLRNGLITREMYDRVSTMFEYYVPLQGFAGETNEDKYEYMGGYHDGRTGTVGKRAKGRKSRATNPFVRIGTNAERTIREAELNRAKNTLYNFLLANSDNDLTSFGSVWYVKTNKKDERGREIWEVSTPNLTDDMSAEELEGAIRAWENDMAALEGQGLAKREANRFELGENVAFMYNQDIPQHCIDVFVNGRRERIYIKGNPRAAQAVNGLLRTRHPDIERVFKSLSRYTSTIYTSGNPQFFVTNFARDLGFATFNVFSKEGLGYLTRFIGNAVRAAQIGVLSSKYKSGNANTDRKMQRLYGLFAQNGGITGYSQIRSDNHYQKEMERELGRGHWLWRALTFIPESFRRITEDGENLLRFAAFLTSYRDGEGKSLTDSIADAKDVTVNFNRKGTGRMISADEAERLIPGKGAGKTVARLSLQAASAILSVGPAFSFFNVSMQGMAQLFRNIKQYPQRSVPALVGMVGMGLLNGIIHGCLNAAMGKNPPEPDDPFYNIPDWERRSNYIIMLGNGNYIKIPISQELRPFYALGDMIAAGLAHKTTQKDMVQEFLSLCGEMLPINPLGEGGLGQSLAPTILSPAVDLLINKDYRGLTIIPERYGGAKAKWKYSYNSTPDWAVEASRAVNGLLPILNETRPDVWDKVKHAFGKDGLSGEDFYSWNRGDSGALDVSPEAIQHLAEGYLGGLFTFASMCYETAEAAIKGEDVNMRRVPFVNRFYARPSDRETGAYLLEMNRYAKKLQSRSKVKMDSYLNNRNTPKAKAFAKTREFKISALYSGFGPYIKDLNETIADTEDERAKMRLIGAKNMMLDYLATVMEQILYDNTKTYSYEELHSVGENYYNWNIRNIK